MFHSARLGYRRLQMTDAPFIFALLNDPAWLENIGDRGIHSLDDAADFIHQNSATTSYLGLYLSYHTVDARPLGLCSILQRSFLSIVDIGYSFLPQASGQGVASEAAETMLNLCTWGNKQQQVAAITAAHNQASIRILSKLNFAYVGRIQSNLGVSNIYLYDLI